MKPGSSTGAGLFAEVVLEPVGTLTGVPMTGMFVGAAGSFVPTAGTCASRHLVLSASYAVKCAHHKYHTICGAQHNAASASATFETVTVLLHQLPLAVRTSGAVAGWLRVQ